MSPVPCSTRRLLSFITQGVSGLVFLWPLAIAAVFVVSIVLRSPAVRAKRAGAQLPPGPERRFLVGNLFNFPRGRWSEAFSLWQQIYGDITYANLAGVSVIVVNSLGAAQELNKRLGIYSGRTSKTMTAKLMHSDWTMLMAQPGANFTEQRKVFRQALGPHVIGDYDGLIQQHIGPFCQALSGISGNPFPAIIDAVGAIVTRLGYGDKVYQTHGEELVRLNRNRIELITWAFTQFWMVDVFPLLRFIPSWFPGANFRKIGKKATCMATKIRFWPYEMVADAMKEGKADDSVLSRFIDNPSLSNDRLRDAMALMYVTGVDTTSTAIINLFYQLLLHPECQRRLQVELDAAGADSRTLSFEEIRKLPLWNAIWKETLRFPPAPLGVPHCTTQDDVWNGYFIPKGSAIYFNIGFMLRDKTIWGEDADLFRPERFIPELNPNYANLPDMSNIPFGFGLRICPGRYLAERVAMQLAVAVLAKFEIAPVDGETVDPSKIEYEDSTVRRPSNLRCQFIPRQPAST